MPAPGCPDPRFRAVIMTNEWQKQPQKLEAMRPSTCVGLNRSSDGTDAVYTLVPTPSPSSAPILPVATTTAMRSYGPRFDARSRCLSCSPRALSLPLPLSPSPRPDGRPGREFDREVRPSRRVPLRCSPFSPLDHPRPPGSLDAWMPLGTRCNSRDTGCVGALGKLSSPAWSLFLLLRDLVV